MWSETYCSSRQICNAAIDPLPIKEKLDINSLFVKCLDLFGCFFIWKFKSWMYHKIKIFTNKSLQGQVLLKYLSTISYHFIIWCLVVPVEFQNLLSTSGPNSSDIFKMSIHGFVSVKIGLTCNQSKQKTPWISLYDVITLFHQGVVNDLFNINMH